jgi:5-bromo-4-chloroindolyl phosphate hydrolysis protein
MPQSRKRPGHHEFHQRSSVPSKQRTKGRYTVAILFAVFGLILGYFGAGDNILVLIITTIVGGLIGYVIGKNMEASAKKD